MAVSVADATSGGVGVRLTVDGVEVAAGGTDVAWTLEGLDWGPGDHELVAEAHDTAGNRSVVARTFTVMATGDDVLVILDEFADAGAVDRAAARRLAAQVDVALRHVATRPRPSTPTSAPSCGQRRCLTPSPGAAHDGDPSGDRRRDRLTGGQWSGPPSADWATAV